MDKRNLKTKEAIKKALITLSKDKPYTEISIRELCQKAGISRSSFYNNYSFFNDVIQEMSQEYMEKLQGKKLTREFFDSLMEDGDELNLLLESGIFGASFSLYLKDLISSETPLDASKLYDDLSLNVMTLYHAYGIFGVLINLIENRRSVGFPVLYENSIQTLMEMIHSFSLGE